MDMDENPAQANIQDVGINLVKQNSTMGRYKIRQKAGVNFIGAESASPNNP